MKNETKDAGEPVKVSTSICLEEMSEENDYLATKLYVSGYDLEELADNLSLCEILFLQFTGELPQSQADRKLLNTLMVLLSTPSPRHPATRAATACGISKTNAEHLLPISLMAIGGDQLGAAEVEKCYRFLTNNIERPVEQVTANLVTQWQDKTHHITPGFGQLYGDIDPLTHTFFNKMCQIKPEGKTIQWVSQFIRQLTEHQAGLLDIGLAACIFHELRLGARESVGLYQLFRAPGLLAYGMEQTHKPVSAIPLVKDNRYELVEK